jgi:hypothetical protein
LYTKENHSTAIKTDCPRGSFHKLCIIIEKADKKPLELYLGSLNDIATIINVNETAIVVQGECR